MLAAAEIAVGAGPLCDGGMLRGRRSQAEMRALLESPQLQRQMVLLHQAIASGALDVSHFGLRSQARVHSFLISYGLCALSSRVMPSSLLPAVLGHDEKRGVAAGRMSFIGFYVCLHCTISKPINGRDLLR